VNARARQDRTGSPPRRDGGAARPKHGDTRTRAQPARMGATRPALPSRDEPAGRPLAPDLQALMAPRFGHDFAKVRLHVDRPEVAARGALAVAQGDDIAFAPGRYAPQRADGRALIAHELAHVVQQARGGGAQGAGDAEARADRAAALALGGRRVDAAALGAAPKGVQAKPDEALPVPQTEPEVDIVTGAGGHTASAPAAPPTVSVLDRFALDRAELTKRQLAAIDRIAFQIWSHLSLHARSEASVSIAGHTDTTGRETHNEGLGGDRAEAAKAALQAALRKQQVDPARVSAITTASFGETRPLAPTGDGVDEPRNRRVEIEVTITVKAPPAPTPGPDARPTRPPLPGTPGGPRIWELPGLMDDIAPPPTIGPTAPPAPKSEGEWLEQALKRDPLLKSLPTWARDKAIGALKDGDEKLVDAIIDKIPFDDTYKAAAKAAAKALLQTLKGRRFKPPPAPPPGLPQDMPGPPSLPKAPGEMIFKLPAIRF
jgi:outer membrane protein OmpA-like peptidoglycan-associated protein